MLRPATMIIAVCALLLAGTPPAAAKVTDQQVDDAIKRGIEYLWSIQQANGDFSPDGKFWWAKYPYPYGHESVAMMALAVAGVPLTDARMKKGFDHLLSLPLEHTYTRSCRAVAISRVINRKDREPDPRAKQVLEEDVKWLMKIQLDSGMWNYPYLGIPPTETNPDFSNTQFAILALQEFEMAGGELPTVPFEKALKIYLERQKPDGGWNYGWLNVYKPAEKKTIFFDSASYGSMTAAGCASMFVIRDKLFSGMGCPCRNGRSGRSPEKIDASIDRAIEWLGKFYQVDDNPTADKDFHAGHFWYWHYSCERVGLASGLKYFGAHDWYAEGAEYIIRHQSKDGSWATFESMYNTAFNIMFLVKGRAPLLVNKLQFSGAWGLHPRDAANLAKYVGRAKEQEMAWQVINLDAPVEEWHDAPLLYISAETPIKLTEEQKKKIRQYTDTGGTILFEASCGNQTVAAWWKKTCAEIWPEWELKLLEKDHPLWSADLKLGGRLPPLWGIFDGVRASVIYSPQDISCPWHTMAIVQQRLLFELGCNLYAYTTDRGKLRAKLASQRAEERAAFHAATIAAGQHNTLRVRLLKHGGDWYVTRHYRPLENLAGYLQERGQVTLQVGEPATITDEGARQTDVFWLTGRKGLMLLPDEVSALKKWLAAGGYLIAEACMGDERFDKDFQTAAADLGLRLRTLDREDPLVTGALAGATGFKLAPLDFTAALRTDRVGKLYAEFRGLYLGDRLVGLYSPFDVSLGVSEIKSYGSRGYAAGDARAVAVNLLLPATTMGANPPGPPPGQPVAPQTGKDSPALPSGYQVTPNEPRVEEPKPPAPPQAAPVPETRSKSQGDGGANSPAP